MMETSVTLYILLILFLVVLAILWIALPFAVFGTKPKLDRLIDAVGETNSRLTETNTLLRELSRTSPDELRPKG